jgi:hypothetical protein
MNKYLLECFEECILTKELVLKILWQLSILVDHRVCSYVHSLALRWLEGPEETLLSGNATCGTSSSKTAPNFVLDIKPRSKVEISYIS